VYQINSDECAILLAHCITPTCFKLQREYNWNISAERSTRWVTRCKILEVK